jgi:hypothetical protein
MLAMGVRLLGTIVKAHYHLHLWHAATSGAYDAGLWRAHVMLAAHEAFRWGMHRAYHPRGLRNGRCCG